MDYDQYFVSYKRFLQLIVEKNPIQDIEFIRIGFTTLLNTEVIGSIIQWTSTYLMDSHCPVDLIGILVHLIVQKTRLICKKNPLIGGFDDKDQCYDTFKLLQLVFKNMNDICLEYLENQNLNNLPIPIDGRYNEISRCSIKNFRRTLEDKLTIIHDLSITFGENVSDIMSYYAIFDGHITHHAATYCSEHLHQFLVESKYYPHKLEEAFWEAFRKTDTMFADKCSKRSIHGGTTAICAVHQKDAKKLTIAWVGDSQAILAQNHNAIQLITPHKPSLKSEESRIISTGGSVICINGIARVDGSLSVSRAIGDFEFRPSIISDPEILTIYLNGHEDFLVLACDGLWEYATEDEVSDFIYDYIKNDHNNIRDLSLFLARFAKHKGSADNITIIVVFLKEISCINQNMEATLNNNSLNSFLIDTQTFSASTNGNDDTVDFFCNKSQVKDLLIDQKNSKNESNFDKTDESDDQSEKNSIFSTHSISNHENDILNNNKNINEMASIDKNDEDVDDTEDFVNISADNSFKRQNSEVSDNVINADSEESEDEWNYYRMENKSETTKEMSNFNNQVNNNNNDVTEMIDNSQEVESQLNPNAAEFVPQSPIRNQLNHIFKDQVISQSPKRGFPLCDFQDITDDDFCHEIKQRPSDANILLNTVNDINEELLSNPNGVHEESAINEVVVDLNTTRELTLSDIDDDLVVEANDDIIKENLDPNSLTSSNVEVVANQVISNEVECVNGVMAQIEESDLVFNGSTNESVHETENTLMECDKLSEKEVEVMVTDEIVTTCLAPDVCQVQEKPEEGDNLIVEISNEFQIVNNESSIEVHESQQHTEVEIESVQDTEVLIDSPQSESEIEAAHCLISLKTASSQNLLDVQDDDSNDNDDEKKDSVIENDQMKSVLKNEPKIEIEEKFKSEIKSLIASGDSVNDKNPMDEVKQEIMNVFDKKDLIDNINASDLIIPVAMEGTVVPTVAPVIEAKVSPVVEEEKVVKSPSSARSKVVSDKVPALKIKSSLAKNSKGSVSERKVSLNVSNSAKTSTADSASKRTATPVSNLKTVSVVKKTVSSTNTVTKKPSVSSTLTSTSRVASTTKTIGKQSTVSSTSSPTTRLGLGVATKVATTTAKPSAVAPVKSTTLVNKKTVSTNGVVSNGPKTSSSSILKSTSGSVKVSATTKLTASKPITNKPINLVNKKPEVKPSTTTTSRIMASKVASTTSTATTGTSSITSVKRPISSKISTTRTVSKVMDKSKILQNGVTKKPTTVPQNK